MDKITLGLAIVAVIEGIKKVVPGINGYVTIALAGLLGFLAGFVGFYLGYPAFAGLDPLTGLITGLAASGSVSVIREARTTRVVDATPATDNLSNYSNIIR